MDALDIEYDASLAKMNTWHIGGLAQILYYPRTIDELSTYIASLDPTTPITWLGLGSNVLIRDGGIKGVVINPTKYLNQIIPLADNSVRVECGVTCAKFSKYCQKQNLAGAEFFAGIPGSMGGALFMNAGAWGGETWPLVAQVEVIERNGQVTKHLPDEYQTAYRKVKGPMGVGFVAGTFKFNQANAPIDLRELIKKRNESQPIGTLNCGSVFKNPEGQHAAKLIESCGLKGYVYKGAQVSPKHANFIINNGQAKASDVEELIALVQAKVLEQHQVQLETEVRFLGEK